MENGICFKAIFLTLRTARKSCDMNGNATFLLLLNGSIDNGESVILVLLDLSTAFDTVNIELLLSLLSTRYGLFWIGSQVVYPLFDQSHSHCGY